jgi:hypothetical protein
MYAGAIAQTTAEERDAGSVGVASGGG